MNTTVVLQTLQADYARFPHDQTYSLYSEELYFKDPMTEFRGRSRYQAMIRLIEIIFLNCKMELHEIQQQGYQIRTEWTLSWNTPLPWKPHIAVPGWSELTVDADGLIASQIDYWHCSRLDLLKQHFGWKLPVRSPASRSRLK